MPKLKISPNKINACSELLPIVDSMSEIMPQLALVQDWLDLFVEGKRIRPQAMGAVMEIFSDACKALEAMDAQLIKLQTDLREQDWGDKS